MIQSRAGNLDFVLDKDDFSLVHGVLNYDNL